MQCAQWACSATGCNATSNVCAQLVRTLAELNLCISCYDCHWYIYKPIIFCKIVLISAWWLYIEKSPFKNQVLWEIVFRATRLTISLVLKLLICRNCRLWLSVCETSERRAHLSHFRHNSTVIDASPLLPAPCDSCSMTPLSVSHWKENLADD